MNINHFDYDGIIKNRVATNDLRIVKAIVKAMETEDRMIVRFEHGGRLEIRKDEHYTVNAYNKLNELDSIYETVVTQAVVDIVEIEGTVLGEW